MISMFVTESGTRAPATPAGCPELASSSVMWHKMPFFRGVGRPILPGFSEKAINLGRNAKSEPDFGHN